jgi:hypothetical protein
MNAATLIPAMLEIACGTPAPSPNPVPANPSFVLAGILDHCATGSQFFLSGGELQDSRNRIKSVSPFISCVNARPFTAV